MELVSKIFETLEVSQLALLQSGLVVVLALLLSTLLIKPILRTFEERENLSVKPIEESRQLLAEADEKARGYDEALRKGAAEALARKRRVMEESSRAGRRPVEAVVEETNLNVEKRKGRIAAEEGTAAALLRAQEAGGVTSVHIPWGEVIKQAINFLILAGVLVYFLRKPFSSFLKERSDLLRKSIDDAAKARAEAAEKLAAIETRTAKLADEIAGMNTKMDVEAAAEARRLQETAAVEISRIRAQSEFTGEQEVKKAREELRREASILTASAAEELVRKTLSPEDQERLVRENLEKIEGIVH